MKGQFTWLLDNGLGIDHRRKSYLRLPDGSVFYEYRFNRDVVNHMVLLLTAMGFDAIRLVPEEKNISQSRRVFRANSIAIDRNCVLISVNCKIYSNGAGLIYPRGIETFHRYSSWEDSKMANLFQEHLVQWLRCSDRGVQAWRRDIISNTDMPAVQTEIGFYEKQGHFDYLINPMWRIRLAEAHVAAIEQIENIGPDFFRRNAKRSA